MNTKDFLRLGVPLAEAAKFIFGGGDKSRREEEVKAVLSVRSVTVFSSGCFDR